MANKIKFGTDGWRAIIAQEFTVENVARVSVGLADYLNSKKENNTVIVGHDCRFGGELFAETAARVLTDRGVKVKLAKGFVSTPMVSLAVLQHQADQGVVITASHNPPTYNGYKLKGPAGGPSSPAVVQAVEDMIPDSAIIPDVSIEELIKLGKVELVNLEDEYVSYLQSKFDFKAINQSDMIMAYDAMYGAGQNVIRRLLPSAELIRCEYNPSFNNQAPEPLDKNLQPLKKHIMHHPEVKIGLATDGDADRIGLYDNDGNFVDAHHIILLLIHYLHHYCHLNGKVVIAFSVTDKVKKLCEFYNLPVEVTKVGFKYISEIMIHEDVLLGGEESGGIAVKGNIPERDGIYDGMLLYDFMIKTGKNLQELIHEVYDIVGPFVYERQDLTLTEEKKQSIVRHCENGDYTHFMDYEIVRTETIDGYKFHFKNGEWLMIRASGTEPVLRVYAEAADERKVKDLLESAIATILADD